MTIKTIITQQKRVIRTINRVWYRSYTEPLFKSNQILKFEDNMYIMQISLFVYDLNNDLLPKSFRNLLSQNCLNTTLHVSGIKLVALKPVNVL